MEAPVTFFLTTDAGVGKESFDALTGEGMAFAEFARTLLFATDGPVLEFTDAAGNPLTGWTANSSDGCIVDNHYACAPSDTPEPAEVDLLGIGLAGLGLMMRRRDLRSM